MAEELTQKKTEPMQEKVPPLSETVTNAEIEKGSKGIFDLSIRLLGELLTGLQMDCLLF